MIETPKPSLLLHPWIGSNPAQNVQKLEKAASRLNLISKISFIAIGAISLTVIGFSFFCSSPTTAIALPLVCSVISTPCLAWVSTQFQKEAMKVQQYIDRELPIALMYKQMQGWSSDEISRFLNLHNIPIPLSIHLPDLIPVIARFLVRSGQTRGSIAESEKYLKSDHISDRELRLWQRNIGWNIREKTLIPFAIEGAFALQVLKEPALQGTVADHFSFLQKTFEERQFDRLFGPDDIYLIFHKIHKDPLSLETLMSHLDLPKLNKLLFKSSD